jgi:hypothetical protein
MRQRGRNNQQIRGAKNVVGNGNQIEEHHHHNHKHTHVTKSGTADAEGEGLAVLGGAAAVLLFSIWFFVKHSSEIYTYLKLASLLFLLPFLMMSAMKVFNADGLYDEPSDWLALGFGAMIVIVTFLLVEDAQGRIDPDVILASQRTSSPWKFWQTLTEYGHQVVIECLLSSIALMMVSLSNLMLGLSVLAEAMQFDWLVDRLSAFKPVPASIACVLFLGIAWGLESQLLFQLVGT